MTETTELPKLDRLIQFDQRSRSFPIRSLLPDKPHRSYTWRCSEYLDQKSEGACCGFGWAHELIARPSEVLGVTEEAAFAIYRRAQHLDPWEGENYEGTSVLAAIKAVQELHPGKIAQYRWCFGINDVIMTLGYKGPVVLGLNWYQGMFNTDSNGIITPTGWLAGGHCILATGYNHKTGFIRLHNSWGKDWGKGGDCFIHVDNLDRLLREQGEACVAVKRAPEKRRMIL